MYGMKPTKRTDPRYIRKLARARARGVLFERNVEIPCEPTSAGIRVRIPGFLLKKEIYDSGILYCDISIVGGRDFIFKEKKNTEEKRNMNKSINGVNIAPCIVNIIFNDPATIVFWSDGTKTVTKTMDGDKFDPYIGLAIAIAKKHFGSNSAFKKVVHSYMKEEEE